MCDILVSHRSYEKSHTGRQQSAHKSRTEKSGCQKNCYERFINVIIALLHVTIFVQKKIMLSTNASAEAIKPPLSFSNWPSSEQLESFRARAVHRYIS